MRPEPMAATDDIDITSLVSVLRRSAVKVVASAVLIGCATFAGLSVVPARYTSETQIRIGGQGLGDTLRDPKVGSNAPGEAATKVDKEAIASQVVALRSRDLAAKLAEELGLARLPEFNSALPKPGIVNALVRLSGLSAPVPGETEEERVLRAYYKALQVYQVKDTRVITIEFTSGDSDLSARAANRLAELHQDILRSQGVSQTADASEWLKPQIEKLAREVNTAESEVERFRSAANLFRGGGQSGSLNEQQLTDLSGEVSKTKAARSDAEARARAARELLQRGSAEAIPDVQKSPVIQALIGQRVRAEREKAEAATNLLPGHPRMKQLVANVADLRRAIDKEAVAIVEGLEKEAKTIAVREELAVKSLEDMKARVGSTANDVAKLAALESQAKAKRRELEALQASFEAARTRSDAKAVPLEATVISSARPSTVPASPKKGMTALMAGAASLIFGFAIVILRELMGGARSRSPRPAVAASRDRATAAAHPASRQFPREPEPEPAEAELHPAFVPAARAAGAPQRAMKIDDIAHRLVENEGAQGGYRAVIVGLEDDGDVREQAVALVKALAAHGRQVALVDWSLDGAGLAAYIGLDSEPGVLDLLDGAATFEDVIRRAPGLEPHVIPCGKASPRNGFDADRLNLVLDALDEAYDHVVVTGPRRAVADLFLTVEGRFDAGITACDRRQAAAQLAPGTFLGFEVESIDLLHLETEPVKSKRKLQLARARAPSEMRH